MKYILLLAGTLLCFNSLFAQRLKKLSPLQAQHNEALTSLLNQSVMVSYHAAMKTTTGPTYERVIAQSTHDSTKTLDDSIKLGYSRYHTSAYDYNTMFFAYNYPYSTSPMFNNSAGIFTKPQVLFDTFTHWAIDPNTETYGYYETAYAGYDTNTYSMTGYKDLFADSSFNPNMLYANKFNTAKNIDTAYTYIWQAGIADSAFKQFFTYNTSNLLTKDSMYEYHAGQWYIVSKTLYTYDGSNNLAQIDYYANDTNTSFLLPLIERLKYVNTYDASHRLLNVYSSFFDGTSLSPYIKDTFAYSGAYTFHNSWKEYQYDPINAYWAPMFNMSKVINSLGEPDTVTIQGFDSLLNSWVPQTLDVIAYNSFKDPDTLKEFDYNFTAFPTMPSFTTVYYYKTYVNSTEVNTVTAINDETKVFPNPADNTITVSQLDVPQNTHVTITLINISGQIVSRTTMLWQNEAQISVAGLMPGVYWVVIQGESGNLLHRQAVVKQ